MRGVAEQFVRAGCVAVASAPSAEGGRAVRFLSDGSLLEKDCCAECSRTVMARGSRVRARLSGPRPAACTALVSGPCGGLRLVLPVMQEMLSAALTGRHLRAISAAAKEGDRSNRAAVSTTGQGQDGSSAKASRIPGKYIELWLSHPFTHQASAHGIMRLCDVKPCGITRCNPSRVVR